MSEPTGETIEDLIAFIMGAKFGDKEFILSRDNLGGWFAAIGNKSKSVCIGEAISYTTDDADFYVEGDGAYDTMVKLHAAVMAAIT